MTATNHALTGTVIGLLVGKPLLALPLAFLSHFICDALPHFGMRANGGMYIKSTFFKRLLYTDMSLCLLLVLGLAIAQPRHWLLASICAFVATSPDLGYLPEYIRIRSGKRAGKPGMFTAFMIKIQWFERPPGAIVEAAWFLATSSIIGAYL